MNAYTASDIRRMNVRWALLVIPLMVIAIAQVISSSNRTEAAPASQAVTPYYTATEAVGFVRGWMSEQRQPSSSAGNANCLAVLERARPVWVSRWDVDHWAVEAAIAGQPGRRYEFWERTWKVVNPNSDC